MRNTEPFRPPEREVWIVQRCLAHYRVPVFDLLAQRLAQRGLVLKVVFDANELEGPADASRPYCDPFIQLQELSAFGIGGWWMRGLINSIRIRRPAAVIVEGMPRIFTNLWLPAVTRAAGGVPLAWVKGHVSDPSKTGELFDRLQFSDWIRKKYLARFDGIICYGNEGKRELERIGVPSARITIARNTVDTRRIFDLLESLDVLVEEWKREHGFAGRRIVLSCGTMYPKKRNLDLINAWPAIHAKHPDAALVLVGGGEMLGAVKRRVAELDDASVYVIGPVPEGEDYKWIAACDVSVMCGGLGLAIQQTLAFGRPMVVADEPGVDGEIIETGVTGWRYPCGDLDALAQTIDQVLGGVESVAETARRGQDLVRTQVNVDGMVDGFISALLHAGVIEDSGR